MRILKRVIAAVALLTGILIPANLTGASDADVDISNRVYEATVEYGRKYGISPELLQALIETESSGNADAVNGGCKGLCQIYEKYHYDRMKRLGVYNICDEQSNILIAADYLAELFKEHGDVCLVLDIYNGNSNAEYNFEYGIISEYANRILKRSAELERLHGK